MKKNFVAYTMLLPNLILFIACSLYPILWTLKYVFYQYGGYATEMKWVGLDNLIRVMHDTNYWNSVKNTFIYGCGKVLIVLPVSFFAALILSKKRRGNGLAQSTIFMPTVMSSAVMGLVFYLLFNAYNGEINKYLLNIGIITRPINWLGKENAMTTIIIVAVWGAIGNYMVYFMAGIQQVSQEAIESAQIDGAGRGQVIRYIIVPMLGPILKIIIMLSITAAFTDITSIMVLTEGGPDTATMVMTLYGYKYFFPVSSAEVCIPQYGYGAAVGLVSAVIAGMVTIAFLKLSKKLDDVY